MTVKDDLLIKLRAEPRMRKPHYWYFQNLSAKLMDPGEHDLIEEWIRVTGTVCSPVPAGQADIDVAVAKSAQHSALLSLYDVAYSTRVDATGEPYDRSLDRDASRYHLDNLRGLLGRLHRFAGLDVDVVFLSCEEWHGSYTEEKRALRARWYHDYQTWFRRKLPSAKIAWYAFSDRQKTPGDNWLGWSPLFTRNDDISDYLCPELYVPWDHEKQARWLGKALEDSEKLGRNVLPFISLWTQYTPPAFTDGERGIDWYVLPPRANGFSFSPGWYPYYHDYMLGYLVTNWNRWDGGLAAGVEPRRPDRIDAVHIYACPWYPHDPPPGYVENVLFRFLVYARGARLAPTEDLAGLAASVELGGRR